MGAAGDHCNDARRAALGVGDLREAAHVDVHGILDDGNSDGVDGVSVCCGQGEDNDSEEKGPAVQHIGVVSGGPCGRKLMRR